LKNGHQHDADEKKRKKNQGFSKKKILLRGHVHQILGNCIRFMLLKAETHVLSNESRKNLL
jgi:hypothetical protein